MRPLTTEEAESIRKGQLRWFRIARIAGSILGLVVLLPWAIRDATRGHWGEVVYLVVFLAAFNGAFHLAGKDLRADLAAGFADTVAGTVERRWRTKAAVGIQIAGREISIRGGIPVPEVGENVTIDFLPHSKMALKVTKGSA